MPPTIYPPCTSCKNRISWLDTSHVISHNASFHHFNLSILISSLVVTSLKELKRNNEFLINLPDIAIIGRDDSVVIDVKLSFSQRTFNFMPLLVSKPSTTLLRICQDHS